MSLDEILIAEIPPAMLAKLKADSRQQAISAGFVWTVLGAFVIPNLAEQFGPSGSTGLPPNQLGDWAGLLVLLAMIGSAVCSVVTMLRGFIGRPALIRAELRYRRQHGKWRWER